jgi:hypothetical protein
MHSPRFLHALTLALGLAFSAVALAGAPQAKGQAPGWYRMMLGDFEVTALSDGTVALPWDKLLKAAYDGGATLLELNDLDG